MSEQCRDAPPAHVEAQHSAGGRSMADVLAPPDSLRQLAVWIIRHDGVRLTEAASILGRDGEAVRQMLQALIEQEFVREVAREGGTWYQICLTSERSHQHAHNLRRLLDEKLGE
jgi:predicted ArsR family transcriptional regulator